jgi:hypothetical protein
MLQFFDELAIAAVPAQNPLPAGIVVTVVDTLGNVTGSAYTQAGGTCAIDVVAGTSYTASFYGTRAPQSSQSFVGGSSDPTQVTVLNYRSPSLSAAGYQLAQADVFPLGRVDPSELLPGGILYDLEMAHGGVLAALDAQVQLALGAERLDSSIGVAIDSWADDFIGPGVWPRAADESDATYIARIKLWFSVPMATLYAMQTLVGAYIDAYVDLASLPGTFGALIVFDCHSDPVLAADVGLVAADADFAILFFYSDIYPLPSFYFDQAYLNQSTYFVTPTYYEISALDAGMSALVDKIKLAGSNPRYFTNYPPSS